MTQETSTPEDWQADFESVARNHDREFAALAVGEKIKRLEDMQELIEVLQKAPRRVGPPEHNR